MGYFTDKRIHKSRRIDNASLVIQAVKELFTFAFNGKSISLNKAVSIINEIQNDFFHDIGELFGTKEEDDLIQYYKELANAKSLADESRIYTAQQLIEEDIALHKALLKEKKKLKKYSSIRQRVRELERAVRHFDHDRVFEDNVLRHDFMISTLPEYFGRQIYVNASFKDYILPKDRLLRMQMLHPGKAEHILGVDLIYEIFDKKNDRVRFIHMQYKMWEKDKLYLNHGNILNQLSKMDNYLCKAGHCCDSSGSPHGQEYRFPYCSAFLRPTDRLQRLDRRQLTSGYHIPVCKIVSHTDLGTTITKDKIKEISVSYRNFADLFVNNMIGSKWIPVYKLFEFYENHNIQELGNSIRIYAKEIEVDPF